MKKEPNLAIPNTTPIDNIKNLLNPYLEQVEQCLLESIRSHRPLINQATQYLISAGGKRIRPMTVLLFSGLSGAISDKSIILASCVELCHTATLIHDDIIDDAKYRRKLKSVNSRWGNQIAVLSGDYLCAIASSMLNSHGGLPFTRLLASCIATMVEGEILELERGYDFHITESEYLEIIRQKTAELISMSSQFGVMVNSDKEEQIGNAAKYGLNIGLAFQIMDDTLDYTSNLINFGKPIQKDVRDGKITLPLIHLRDRLNKSDRKHLENILLKSPDKADLKWVYNSLLEHGSLQYAQEYARTLVENVKEKLDLFPSSDYKQALFLLGDYIVQREF